MYGVASNSKLFTTISVGMLIDDGTTLSNGEKLDWTTKIRDIFPELVFPEESMNQMMEVVDFMCEYLALARIRNAESSQRCVLACLAMILPYRECDGRR